ncbi:methyltransferase domain-containing protein [Alteromonas confluentis]|uniref:SAM-dependent methyltransferase n=1 Tax=Alteromonas confluentis TaxID=1656094 RepID=A0A1E7ZBP7_9ALTE|nr:methyltransferase domain-containing protein [Alteromonas confluentis]OFC70943.1 SAM-dependent methyltransferase [Alteromonas confluentis]
MKLAYRAKPPRYPLSWSELPAGEAIHDAVQSVSNSLSSRVFGYHFVKLGALSSAVELPKCGVSHHIRQAPEKIDNASVVSLSSELPYVENSIDGFLLANELDFCQDPHQILREVDRCITQDGYVIISGFNPFSLTGIGKYLPLKRGNLLHDARFFSSGRVKDWLQLLGFEVIETRHILFSMLFLKKQFSISAKWHSRVSRYFPWCSSVYVIIARKRVVPMTTIKPQWKLKPRFSAVGASMRLSDGACNEQLGQRRQSCK